MDINIAKLTLALFLHYNIPLPLWSLFTPTTGCHTLYPFPSRELKSLGIILTPNYNDEPQLLQQAEYSI
jgi:hypothetical protein